jgi:hypothetical protein
MTEAEWLTATESLPMLQFLQESGKVSERKLRLFACACVRRVWHLLRDERSREALEVAERFADGRANRHELNEAYQAGEDAGNAEVRRLFAVLADAERAAVDAVSPVQPYNQAGAAALHAVTAMAENASKDQATSDESAPLRAWFVAKAAECQAQCALARCIFGNPFRPLAAVSPAWLKWNDSTVLRIATSIYERSRWGDLPILADALLDSGCGDAAMLEHLRGLGPHARGCWVLDALLGKG